VFGEIPSAERYVSVVNGIPGLRRLVLRVNGQVFVVEGLADGESRAVDVGSAMLPGEENVVALVGEGDAGASADITIGDAPVGNLVASVAVAPVVLQVERVAEGLRLSWPESASGWVLASQAALGSAWEAWSEAPSVRSGRNTVVVPVDAGDRWFRLVRP
jgi:hypothetical protein